MRTVYQTFRHDSIPWFSDDYIDRPHQVRMIDYPKVELQDIRRQLINRWSNAYE